MMRMPALSLFLATSLACDDAPSSQTRGPGASCDPSAPSDDCADPALWCTSAATCATRPVLGEVCDPAPCLDGLHCHIDKRCGELRAEGEACASSFECEPALVCNHGELPELFAVGLCRALAPEGAPCGYEHAALELIGRALAPHDDRLDRGDCLPGLSCAPVFPPPGGTDAPPSCAPSKGVACFFSGVCTLDGSLPLGAPCTRSAACESGVCAVFEPPLSATALPGFGKGGEWLGPRVGRCVGPDDALVTCGRADPCPATFTCIDRQCIAPHTQRPGEVCSDPAGVECALGLVCDGRACRYP